MIKKAAFPELREQAIALRRAGRSRREIKDLLGIGSNQTLNEVLKGEPPLPQNVRPNAKDVERAKARELRTQGLDYNRIAAELGVSKGSVSLWVRDLPRPEPLNYEECRRRAAEGVRRYWAAERPVREAQREAARAAAAAQIGPLNEREILIAGAIAYWCEGAKNKPYRRTDRVVFMNSDPALIGLFLRFVETAGIGRDKLIYQVQIHETADVSAAQRFWLDVTGADPAQFRPPRSNGTIQRPCGRIQATTITAAYASKFGAVPVCTARSKAGRPPLCPLDRERLSDPVMIRTRVTCSRARIRTSVDGTKTRSHAS
jgi:transcriptional regulator with XRE-family HTH domain